MDRRPIKNLEIYTEKEIKQHLIIGRPFRPGQSSFLLLKMGKIELAYNLTPYKLDSSTVLLIRPDTVYEILNIGSDTQLRFISFNSDFESLPAIKIRRFDSSSFLNSNIQKHYAVEPIEFNELWGITELLRGRIALQNQPGISKEIVHHLFLSLIYILADVSDKYNQIKLSELSRSENLTLEFIKLLSVHFRSERNLAFYAHILSISPKHLSETTKSCSGYTAGELINHAIITEAKIMLAKPAATIKQVASELNFSDQYAFSKFFKRLTRMNPSEFKGKI